MFSRYNLSTMSDIDPQATNDLSPDPSAEKIEQSPSPATPSAETPAEEAVPADSTPENLSSGISAEVDALLADQEAASDPKAASPPAEENVGTPSVDPTAILDAALGAMNAADNLVELAPGHGPLDPFNPSIWTEKKRWLNLAPKTVESAASISLIRSPTQVTDSFSCSARPRTRRGFGHSGLRVQPRL